MDNQAKKSIKKSIKVDCRHKETAMTKRFACIAFTLLCICFRCFGADSSRQSEPERDWRTIGPSPADQTIAEYFRTETVKLRDRCLADIKTPDEWKAKRQVYRRQLLEMFGLDPLPEKTDLKPVITGKIEHDEFIVEKIHFQSRPNLYVTANLYIPKSLEKPAPAILYVCGHSRAKKDGVIYGNKTRYQHHAAWFARHGYVCLIMDTLQLGEIEGIHHGTHRYNMWWWISRGYTPAGVEAWNCIRALDYLDTREEVDKDRIGVTGRSGGGAYSWWISALDDRIKAAVPVAGITDLQNHVVDGCIEGHCDCMFIVNTYRWDYPLVAALVAPRPLLISNSDKDKIFPLDGVIRLHEKVRNIYRLYDAENNLGLHITEGPHKDTQELRIHAFVWFNRFLKDENPLIDKPAVSFFEQEQLKVFNELPADQINTEIHESFVAKAPQPSVPQSTDEWAELRESWMKVLREKSFRGWPTKAEAGSLDIQQVFCVERHGICFSAFDFTSQPHVRLRLYLVHRAGLDKADQVVLNTLDEQAWTEWLAAMQVGFADEFGDQTVPEPNENTFNRYQEMLSDTQHIMAYIAPRGIGLTAWNPDQRKSAGRLTAQTQIRRRFMLLGQTLDGMRVWDVRRTIQTLRTIDSTSGIPLTLKGKGQMAGIVLYASLFEPDIDQLDLWHLPCSHRDGPTFLNVLRYLDIPQAVAMAAERSQIRIYVEDNSGWQDIRLSSVEAFPRAVAKKLGWSPSRIRVN